MLKLAHDYRSTMPLQQQAKAPKHHFRAPYYLYLQKPCLVCALLRATFQNRGITPEELLFHSQKVALSQMGEHALILIVRKVSLCLQAAKAQAVTCIVHAKSLFALTFHLAKL